MSLIRPRPARTLFVVARGDIGGGGSISRRRMWSLVCAVLVCGAGASACAGGHPAPNAARSQGGIAINAAPHRAHPGPGGTAVAMPISAFVAVDTGVVRVRGVDWFATAESSSTQVNVVRIYRWEGSAWSLRGTVSVAQAPSMYGEGGVLTAVSLTGSDAPDFTLTTGGADWVPFAVISRVGGSWHEVPFDYETGPTDVIDELGVRGKLVQAGNSPCGCANGSPTSIWYRFAGRIFVPTVPPGPSAPCTAAAFNAARPNVWWFADTDLESEHPTGRDVRALFAVSRFACSDGWALATGTARGQRMFAIFAQVPGARWERGAVAPASALTADAEETALPVSLLDRLAIRIGHPLHPAAQPKNANNPYGDNPGPPGFRQGRDSASIPVTPGSSFASEGDSGLNRPGWYAAAVQSHPYATGRRASLAVYVYRWTGMRWVASGTVRLSLGRQHGVGTPYFESLASFTGSRLPDFTVAEFYPRGWLAVISHVGGRWHAVPFRSAEHASTVVTGAVFGADSFSGGELVTPATIAYRFVDGAFELTGKDTTCQARFLRTPGNTEGMQGHYPITHLVCVPGWALGYGSQHGKTIAILYNDGGTWSAAAATAPTTLHAYHIGKNGLPPEMLTELERQQEFSGAPRRVLIELDHLLVAHA